MRIIRTLAPRGMVRSRVTHSLPPPAAHRPRVNPRTSSSFVSQRLGRLDRVASRLGYQPHSSVSP